MERENGDDRFLVMSQVDAFRAVHFHGYVVKILQYRCLLRLVFIGLLSGLSLVRWLLASLAPFGETEESAQSASLIFGYLGSLQL